ncbi:copper amine oxidase N-terminal domain-containing protein [Aminipila sp.]|uniref:copper amine oxidase N-terminal domain-containing protein n=1 Tax=Aminipila sp. TaxID=2060095 RepID=UPI00289E7077|nr:copper amine oxidase N-terminal domain-containing protein [Aminipila sp.]
MKMKNGKYLLALILILLFNVNYCFAETQIYDFYKQVNLVVGENIATVNQKVVTMDQAAYLNGGRTMVPFRFLGESLGAKVSWDASTKQAKLSLSGVDVTVTVGSLNGLVDGKIVKMDVPAVNKGGRLFIPLRFVSENLGAIVNYYDETNEISIRYSDTSNWKTYEASNNMTYKYPATWSIGPTKDDQYTISVKSPNGSELITSYDDRKPKDLISEFKDLFSVDGWKLETTLLDDESNIDNGYELVFSMQEKNGSYSYIHVFVDVLGTGSNIGICKTTEETDEMDCLIFYQIMAS